MLEAAYVITEEQTNFTALFTTGGRHSGLTLPVFRMHLLCLRYLDVLGMKNSSATEKLWSHKVGALSSE